MISLSFWVWFLLAITYLLAVAFVVSALMAFWQEKKKGPSATSALTHSR